MSVREKTAWVTFALILTALLIYFGKIAEHFLVPSKPDVIFSTCTSFSCL